MRQLTSSRAPISGLPNLLAPVLGVAALTIACIGILGCGGEDDSVSQAELAAAKREARNDARQEAEINDLQRELKEEQGDDNSAGTPSPSTPVPQPSAPAPSSGIPSSARDCG